MLRRPYLIDGTNMNSSWVASSNVNPISNFPVKLVGNRKALLALRNSCRASFPYEINYQFHEYFAFLPTDIIVSSGIVVTVFSIIVSNVFLETIWSALTL